MKIPVYKIARPVGLLLLVAAFCPAAQAEVELVRNKVPAGPPRTIQLEEIWRVGGEDGDLLFGAIVGALADPSGNVYLLDHHLKQVEVIAPDGRHLRTLSREGDGPGEIRNPREMIYLPDERIGLAELFPSKLITLTLDGEPGGTINMGGSGGPETGFRATMACGHRGGSFLFAGQHSVPNDAGMDRVQFLSLLEDSGQEKVRLREATTVLDFASGVLVEKEILPCFLLANAVGPDGRVFVPRDRDTYAIEVYGADGTPELVIEREFDNRPRTKREMRRFRTVFEANLRDSGLQIECVIEPRNPAIDHMFVDAEHRLWVKHARSSDDLPAGVLLKYDLFDAAGRYLHEVHLACDGDAAFDDFAFLTDGRVLLIKGYVLAQWETFDTAAVNWDEDEDSGPMEVICYRMPF